MATQVETTELAAQRQPVRVETKLIFAGALLFLAGALVGFSLIVTPALSGHGGDTTDVTYVGP